MARSDTEFSIKTEGLRDLNRALGKISKDLRKESIGELREIAKRVRSTARANTRVKTGEMAGSLRYSATNKGAAIRSNLVRTPIFEYGGTIRPRGVPITIPRDRMVGRAIESDADRIEDDIGNLLDRIARSNGFR